MFDRPGAPRGRTARAVLHDPSAVRPAPPVIVEGEIGDQFYVIVLRRGRRHPRGARRSGALAPGPGSASSRCCAADAHRTATVTAAVPVACSPSTGTPSSPPWSGRRDHRPSPPTTPATTTADGHSAHASAATSSTNSGRAGDHHDRVRSASYSTANRWAPARAPRPTSSIDERAVLARPRVVRELDDLARRRPDPAEHDLLDAVTVDSRTAAASRSSRPRRRRGSRPTPPAWVAPAPGCGRSRVAVRQGVDRHQPVRRRRADLGDPRRHRAIMPCWARGGKT